MTQVFVITEDSSLADAVRDYFKLTGLVPVHEYRLRAAPAPAPGQVPTLFRQLADWLEATASQGGGDFPLRDAVAVVSLLDPETSSFEALSPTAVKEGGWAAVVAMLVLAFPEVHWVFDSYYEPLDNPLFRRLHLLTDGGSLTELMAMRDAGYSPLFDPTGLRAAIRARLRLLPESNYVPVRTQVAAAVDEEGAYAHFTAYIAYRLGFRTHVVTSYGMFEEVLKKVPAGQGAADGRPDPARHAVSLVFEDLYLNFPDKPHTEHLSDLAARDRFEGLAHAPYRVLVTVGHRRTADPNTEAREAEYVEGRRRRGKQIKMVYKPLSGIFNVWQKSGLRGWLRDTGGCAPDFVWPPPPGADPSRAGSHSAPGRLLEVADRLVHRARAVARNVHTVPDAIYGATLALEAQEYLGHRTPTSSLEALALKHSLEVSAECLFYGVEHNKDVGSRFQEVERDVNSIGRWLRPATQRISVLDAQAGIISDLVLRFREHYQFDEEQACLNKLRRLHRLLWLHKNKLWGWLVYPFRWYVETLLSSILLFALAIVLWVVGLSFAFSENCDRCHEEVVERSLKLEAEMGRVARDEENVLRGGGAPPPAPTPNLAARRKTITERIHGLGIEHGLAHGVTTFFGIQPAHGTEHFEEYEPLVLALNVLAIFAGFVHLGIFVSHLYSLVARR